MARDSCSVNMSGLQCSEAGLTFSSYDPEWFARMVYTGNSWLEGTLLLNIPVIAIAYVHGVAGEHLVPLHPPVPGAL